MSMELWYAPTSPFSRKVRVAAHEIGEAAELALVETDPWSDPRLRGLNPLAKVPVLLLEDGEVIWESGLIVEWLAAFADRPDIVPPTGARRGRALSLQALADGACTAAGRLFADERRRPDERCEALLLRFETALEASLDHLEDMPLFDGPAIGEISVAVLLAYLDFRWPGRDWRGPRPELARWFERFSARPSMAATAYRVAPRDRPAPLTLIPLRRAGAV
jgi:glutathione S-transferase